MKRTGTNLGVIVLEQLSISGECMMVAVSIPNIRFITNCQPTFQLALRHYCTSLYGLEISGTQLLFLFNGETESRFAK